MEKGGQKRPNCTVKTRKSGAFPQENSLIESRIDANFLDLLDKVRGSARRLPIDPTPCLNVQASRCDYRAEEILDRMPRRNWSDSVASPIVRKTKEIHHTFDESILPVRILVGLAATLCGQRGRGCGRLRSAGRLSVALRLLPHARAPRRRV